MRTQLRLQLTQDMPSSRYWRNVERLARADREALHLRFGEPCDPRRLVDWHDISTILEEFTGYARFFRLPVDDIAAMVADLDAWSCTMFVTAGQDYMMMVNPTHVRCRRTFTIAHEFGHLVLGHQPISITETYGCLLMPRYSDAQEAEAYDYALGLLIPFAPLVQFLAAGITHTLIGHHYGVSREVVEMRLKKLGIWQPAP